MEKRPQTAQLTIEQCRKYLDEYTFRLKSRDAKTKRSDSPGLVGLEIEMLPVTQTSLPGAVPSLASPKDIAAILRKVGKTRGWELIEEPLHNTKAQTILTLAIIPNQGTLSFEPGGQLELSTFPMPCLADALDEAQNVQKFLDQVLREHDIRLLQIGMNPWHAVDEIGLQIPKKRYVAMDRYLSSLSPFGQRMMRQTCTIQVCLDFGPTEEFMARRFLTSYLLAPFATAMFAFSPFWDGKATGDFSSRSRIWRNLDSSRTGIINLRTLEAQMDKQGCIDAYLEFALNAHVIFVKGLDYFVPKSPLPFRQWLKDGLNGVFPTLKDFILHLSLLFPEVRPRGFFEIRSIDCQARALQSLPPIFFTSLLYDDKNLGVTESLLLPYIDQIPDLLTRASQGLSDPVINKVAQKLISLAVEGFSRLPSCFRTDPRHRILEAFKEHYTDRSRTPAHDLLEMTGGSALTLSHLATFTRQWNTFAS